MESVRLRNHARCRLVPPPQLESVEGRADTEVCAMLQFYGSFYLRRRRTGQEETICSWLTNHFDNCSICAYSV